MNTDSTEHWNTLYTDTSPVPPAKVLQDNLHLLPSEGKALDIACGLAENGFLLAAHGITVDAWDNANVAVQRVNEKAQKFNLSVTAKEVDIFKINFPVEQYDVIIFTHYLEQSLSESIVAALKPGGLLFFQAYTREKVNISGPEDLKYRLKPNELLSMFSELKLIVYREEGRLGRLEKGFRDKAMLVAQKVAETKSA